jgi:hypothetical protein
MIKYSNNSRANIQKLLDIIYDSPEFYPGSFHEKIDIQVLLSCINNLLLNSKNKSLHIIIDKTSDNSLNLTVDKAS